MREGRILVKTRAKPQDGAANDAVVRMVAESLGLPVSHCRLLRGATSREKILSVEL